MTRTCLAPFLAAFLVVLPLWATAEGTYPLTLRDASGYPVTLRAKPQAVVSLTLATDELLFDLIDHRRLKAISAFASDPAISNIAEFARTFPLKLTGDKEKIIALQPDLVFLASWKEKDFVQALRDAKVPVFVFGSPDTFEQLKVAVTQIATLVGEPLKGQALVDDIERRLDAVAGKVGALPQSKRVSVLSYSFYGSTYGRGTSFDALAEKAGLVNVATQAGMTGWPLVSKEQILTWDPDLIVLPSWSYEGKTEAHRFLADFVKDPVFAGLRAVQTQRVIILQDRHLLSSSQYMVDGVEELARVAYPTLFR